MLSDRVMGGTTLALWPPPSSARRGPWTQGLFQAGTAPGRGWTQKLKPKSMTQIPRKSRTQENVLEGRGAAVQGAQFLGHPLCT